MKVLLFCRTDKTKLMVHIAKFLKELDPTYSFDAFVAYYDRWRDYLREQDHVSVGTIFGTKEIYQKMGTEALDYVEIERIEKEYGSSGIELWNMIYSERYLTPHTHPETYNHPKYSPEEKLLYVQICFQVVEEYFEKNRPNFVLDFADASIVRLVIDKVAEKRGVRYIIPYHTLVSNFKCLTVRVIPNFEDIQKEYLYILKNKSTVKFGDSFLKDFKNKKIKKAYSVREPEVESFSFASAIRGFFQRNKFRTNQVLRELSLRKKAKKNTEIKYNFNLYKDLFTITILRKVLFFLRKVSIRLNNPFISKLPTQPFVFMTLHVQPETSNSLLSPFFVDQLHTVRQVSASLPLGWKLVVKPNRLMIGKESVSMYRKMNRLPNVCVISPNLDTYDCIQRSIGVFSITGTSGFEAVMLGKKVVVCSHKPIWTMIKSVSICTDFTKLHGELLKMYCFREDVLDTSSYLQAVHNKSFDVGSGHDIVWYGPYSLESEEYKEGVSQIAKEVYYFMKSS